jgi:hypothetical protein
VGTWRGESTTALGSFDIAVVVTKHDGVSDAAIRASKYVFDCTGSISGAEGI